MYKMYMVVEIILELLEFSVGKYKGVTDIFRYGISSGKMVYFKQ